MAPAVFQDLFIGTANGKVISHMIDPCAFPGRKLTDIFGFVGFLYGKKSVGSLCITTFQDTLQRDDYPALKKYRKLFLKRIGKALFGGNADLPEGVRLFYRLDQDVLGADIFQKHRAFFSPEPPGFFHLLAAVHQTAPDHEQFLDPAVNDRELVFHGSQTAVNGIVLHMFFDLAERKADFLHNENGIQVVQLLGTVVPVSVIGIYIIGTKQADFVIEDQGLL